MITLTEFEMFIFRHIEDNPGQSPREIWCTHTGPYTLICEAMRTLIDVKMIERAPETEGYRKDESFDRVIEVITEEEKRERWRKANPQPLPKPIPLPTHASEVIKLLAEDE